MTCVTNVAESNDPNSEWVFISLFLLRLSDVFLVSRVQLITVGFPPKDVLIIPELDNYLCPQEQLTHPIAGRQRRLGEAIKSFNIFYVGYKRSFVTNISMKCQIPSFLAF